MDIIKNKGFCVAVGCHDAHGAKIARKVYLERMKAGQPCQFDMVYVTGWGNAAFQWGRPDMGIHTRTDLLNTAEHIIENAHPLVVGVDIETGLGNTISLPDTISLCHRLRAAYAHLEDQGDKRRCGQQKGRMVIETEEFEDKLRASLLTLVRLNSSTRLMARTDALGAANWDSPEESLKNAIERARRYMSVEIEGRHIDLMWAEFPTPDPEVVWKYVEAVRPANPNVLLAINYSPNKWWMDWYRKNRPGELPPTYEQLHQWGFSLIFHTIYEAVVSMIAIRIGMNELASNGAAALWAYQDQARTLGIDFQKETDADLWQELEIAIQGDRAVERLVRSEGYGIDPLSAATSVPRK